VHLHPLVILEALGGTPGKRHRLVTLGDCRLLDGSGVVSEREMCPWAISKYFGDLVSNTSA
jgi:hypothetical protein